MRGGAPLIFSLILDDNFYHLGGAWFVATSCASTVLPSRVGCVGGVFAPRVKTSVSRGKVTIHFDSVADPDPGSGAFLTPGSGIRIPDPKPIWLRA